jgi:hypothetical protein
MVGGEDRLPHKPIEVERGSPISRLKREGKENGALAHSQVHHQNAEMD